MSDVDVGQDIQGNQICVDESVLSSAGWGRLEYGSDVSRFAFRDPNLNYMLMLLEEILVSSVLDHL